MREVCLQLRLRGGQFALYGRLQLSVLFMFRHPAVLGDARSSNVEELVLSNYDLAEHDRGLFEAFWDFKRHPFV